MAKQAKGVSERARKLLTRLVFPDAMRVGSGAQVSTAAIARAIATDDHPGDDTYPPRWLRESARQIVKLTRLLKTAGESGDPLHLDGETALACCDAYEDDLRCLGNAALSEAIAGNFGVNPMTPENSALVLVLGVLMLEADTYAATNVLAEGRSADGT